MGSASTSLASATPWPPLTRTAQPKRSASSHAAACCSSASEIGLPVRAVASGMLGVITRASGSSLPVSTVEASSLMRRAPDVATMTGSTTMFSARQRSRRCAIVSMMAAEDTMPIFTAAGGMSSNTASICSPTNSGVASSTPRTPVVFCAVSAVMAVSANSPWAAIVLMSAWMPAPPLESEPAIDSTAGTRSVSIVNLLLVAPCGMGADDILRR